MPAAWGALELLGIAVFLFLFAFLYATKWTLQPLVSALHSGLGWVPGVGNLVDRVDRAVLGAIDSAIHGVEASIVVLWHGVIWSWDETVGGLAYFTAHTLEALRYLHNTAIPDAIHAVVGTVVADVHALENKSLDLLRDTFGFIAALETKIVHMGNTTYDRVVHNLPALVADDIEAGVQRAERAGRDAIATLKTAEDTAITNARAVGQSALDEIAHAVAVPAEEVLHLPGLALDDLEKMLRGVNWGKLAGTLGAVPLIYAAIRALEAEAGLGNAECRGKVKQICGTDPNRWLHLLEGLAALGFAFDFNEIVHAAQGVVHEARPLLDRLAQ